MQVGPISVHGEGSGEGTTRDYWTRGTVRVGGRLSSDTFRSKVQETVAVVEGI